MTVKILYLYSSLLNLYGNVGNILCLERHLKHNGLEVEITKADSIKEISFENFDIVYMGSGTERSQKAALLDLNDKRDELISFCQSGKILLCLGNSFEMLGKSITDVSGNVYDAVGLFDYETKEIKTRIVKDTVCKFKETEIIGFMNKQSQTYNVNNPLFEVISGEGNSLDTKTEGASLNNVFATCLAGPILVRNPRFREHIEALLYKNLGLELVPYSFANETLAYNESLNSLK